MLAASSALPPAPAEGPLRRSVPTRNICGGNTRIRALQLTGDPWAEDPACYLSDAEIGVEASERLTVTPFRGKSHDPAHDFR